MIDKSNMTSYYLVKYTKNIYREEIILNVETITVLLNSYSTQRYLHV